MYDVVIIGAGFAGLSAAALLGKQGRKVLVIERAGRLGGRGTYYEKDGILWEYGQHSFRLGPDGYAAKVFNRLGIQIEFVDSRTHRACLYFDGKLYPRPEGPLQFLTTRLLPFGARVDFLRFYVELLRQDPNRWYDTTLLDFYRLHHRNADVVSFLRFVGLTTMVPDPARASAGEVIHFLKRAQRAKVKQGEPKGGTRQLIEKLERAILDTSGTIHCSESALEIMIDGKCAVGVKTPHAEYRCGSVVHAVPLSKLFHLIHEDVFNPGFVAYIKSIQSSTGLNIDFVTNRPLAEDMGSILGVDVPIWVKFPTNFDPQVAPKGLHISTWGILFPFDSPVTPQVAHDAENRIDRVLAEVFPGARDHIVEKRRMVIPVINGNVLMPRHSYPHRPAIASTDVRNLFFVGDTTQGEGCSSDIAFSSALRLAELLPA